MGDGGLRTGNLPLQLGYGSPQLRGLLGQGGLAAGGVGELLQLRPGGGNLLLELGLHGGVRLPLQLGAQGGDGVLQLGDAGGVVPAAQTVKLPLAAVQTVFRIR